MSKQIDYTQPLSPEDKAYAAQFPGLHGGMLQVHAEQFPEQEPESLDGSDSGDEVPPYSEWKHAELVAEAKRRNVEEGTNLKTSGSKEEMVAVLEADDAARPVSP